MILTIFTPTYNRAYCLKNLYNSLCIQKNKNFIWLIIDDGSNDNTEDLIKKFKHDKILNIEYIKQKNSGKHVATNRALEKCDTELIFCIDSDDYLANESVIDIILDTYKQNKDKILGMYFRRIDKNGNSLAGKYPKGKKMVGITDLYHKYNYKGDTAIILKTKYLQNVRFPVFENEKFVTERVFYNKINHIAPMLLCEDKIYVCDYLKDGYTKNANKLIIDNPYGSATFFLSESIYANKLLVKSKNYAQFKTMVKMFKLKKEKFNIKPNIFIRILGGIFENHYFKLYNKITNETMK